MARLSLRLPENVPGEFYVDSSCIDCGVCREMAPHTFSWSERGRSFVSAQPRGSDQQLRAAMALVSCPTASIGTERRKDLAPAIQGLPTPLFPGVEYCGFTSASTFGAASYLILRPGGNVLVDSPRATEPLFKGIAARGGLALMFLTHRDDVGDHSQFHRRFGCERILHGKDLGAGTRGIERVLRGSEPVRVSEDLLAIPVPGHTAGSTVLLYKDLALFTGDHLFASEDGEHLEAARELCWYSWAEQTRSMETLLDFRFEWVLPGHGRRFHAEPSRLRAELARLVRRMASA
jgi:glyoxylase-like metal-dependent hydrolase (beta-lactamase superfamily II)/ferredoxin